MSVLPEQANAPRSRLPSPLAGARVHLVGIKGTGMAALAEVLVSRGARVTGSDVPDVFYTDAVLRRLGIPYAESFDAAHVPPDAQLVVHSAAYRRAENPELSAAVTRGLPLLQYPEALGEISALANSSGVSGVHGKSTTTALCGVILRAWGLPATVLVGAEVPAFGGRSTLVQGSRYFVAETCEYRRHFLNFRPARIVITSIEPDHLDYFRDLDDLLDAFCAYGRSLPPGGALVYCRDDPGARTAAGRILADRPDVVPVPYGRTADGPWQVIAEEQGEGESRFRLGGCPGGFALRIPGAHNVLNAAAALALCSLLWEAERPGTPPDMASAAAALSGFTGSRRRSEIVGEAGGVLVMDDYAHHPTAVRATLEGLRRFHPGRRLVVDFMSHTYSRTRALLPEFGAAFGAADIVVLHGIYASARETNDSGVGGRDLLREVQRHRGGVHYYEEPLAALPFLEAELRPGDLFLTMGAGDNWKIGREILRRRGGIA